MLRKYKAKFYKAWSIGLYAGESPFNIKELKNNPVFSAEDINDLPVHFVADPFIIEYDKKYYIFFEMLNADTGRGEIGVAIGNNYKNYKYEGLALRETFHLSYPQVFEWNKTVYMIPESSDANAIRVYRATQFPRNWKYVMNLMEGKPFVDPTIFHFNNVWWLYTTYDEEYLRLYYSDDLLSNEWSEHPKSPVVGGNYARPAGRILRYQNRMYRFSQDNLTDYGNSVICFEIKQISKTEYNEVKLSNNPFLRPSGSGWNGEKIHHLDFLKISPDKWIVITDGFSNEMDLRFKILYKRIKQKFGSKFQL